MKTQSQAPVAFKAAKIDVRNWTATGVVFRADRFVWFTGLIAVLVLASMFAPQAHTNTESDHSHVHSALRAH